MSVEIFSSISPEELQTALDNKLFRGILDSMPNGVQVLNALRNEQNEVTDFVCVFANDAAENYFGRKITGKKISSFFKKTVRPFFFEKFAHIIASGATQDFVYHHAEEEVQKWYHYTINKFGDGVLVTQEDITGQKKAELKLKDTLEQKEEADLILNTMNSACYELDENGVVIFVNEKAKQLFHLTEEQMLGRNIWEIFPQAINTDCFEAIQKNALENKTYAQHEYISPVLHKWISLSATPTKKGCIVLFTEIEEQKLEQEVPDTTVQLKEQVELLQRSHAILNSIDEACYELDKNGSVVYVNRQALEWWGMKEEDVIGKNIWKVFPESIDTHCYDAIQISALNNKQSAQYDYVSAVLNRWITLSAKPTATGCVVVFRDIDERKKAEQEMLRITDELFKKTIDEQLKKVTAATPALLTRLDRDMRYVFVNQATVDFLKLPFDKIIGKPVIEVLGKEAYEQILPYIERVLKGERVEFETEISYPTAGTRTVRVIYVPSVNSENKVDGWYATIIDVTRQKAIEEALRTSEEQLKQLNALLEQEVEERIRELHEKNISLLNFKRIMDTTHDSVVCIDTSGNVTYWSPSSERMYGFTSEETLGKQLTDFIVPPEKRHEFSNLMDKVSEGKFITDFVTKRITKDGRTLDVQINFFSLKDDKGNITGSCRIAKDITEKLASEKELIKQHNILKQAEEIAKTGSWEYDINTKEFLWSEGMYELFEMEKGTPVSPSLYLDKTIGEDRPIAQKIVTHIEQKPFPIEEELRIRADGKIKILKIKSSPVNNNGNVAKVVGVDMDITEVKEAEEKIKELNAILLSKNRELEAANSELRTFSSLAASDYKDTLKNLYTLFEFIITNDARHLSNSGRANLRRAQSAIQKMKLLTDDVVAYSQIQIAEKDIAAVDLSKTIDAVRQKLDNKIKETSAKIESDKLPVIKGYADLIQLLFFHLINNAIKFRKEDTPPAIKIVVSQVNGRYINRVEANPIKWYHIVSITDNGIGFEQKQAEKIFNMFSRLHEKNKYKGSGIGLAICKKIMNIHDGFITAESEPGQGATFNCYFLLQKQPSSTPHP